MVRLFIAVLGLSFAVSAHANLKLNGTLVLDACSRKIVAASPEKMVLPKVICDAKVVGTPSAYLTIDDKVWVVTKTQNRGNELLQEIQLIGSIVGGRLQMNVTAITLQGQVIRQNQYPATRIGVLTNSIKVWAFGFEKMLQTL